jgi:hypothetical protein
LTVAEAVAVMEERASTLAATEIVDSRPATDLDVAERRQLCAGRDGGRRGGKHSRPLTSAVLVFELSGDYAIVLPLLLATVVGTTVSRGLGCESVYEAELRRKGLGWQLIALAEGDSASVAWPRATYVISRRSGSATVVNPTDPDRPLMDRPLLKVTRCQRFNVSSSGRPNRSRASSIV